MDVMKVNKAIENAKINYFDDIQHIQRKKKCG